MTICHNPDCIGWALGDDDRFCAWCAVRLQALRIELQSRTGEAWTSIPPTDVQPSELRVVISNAGLGGRLDLAGASVTVSEDWLRLDLSPLPCTLGPGDSVALPVKQCSPPIRDSLRPEAIIQVQAGGSADELIVDFAPPPSVRLDLAPDTPVGKERTFEADLVLNRGTVVLSAAPSLRADWARVEVPAAPSWPLVLASRLTLRFRVTATTVAGPRSGTLLLPLAGRSEPLEVPIETRLVPASELRVEPFRDTGRYDLTVLRGIGDRQVPFVLHNGLKGTAGLPDLVVTDLQITTTEGEPWLRVTVPPGGWRIPSGQNRSVSLPLTLPPGATERLHHVRFVCNGATTLYYLNIVVQEPQPFRGFLVIDYGTTNTCAVLVDTDGLTQLVSLDDETAGHPQVLPSIISYQRLVSAREYRVGFRVWELLHLPQIARASVAAAKRYVGNGHSFTIVPEQEVRETVRLPVREVVDDTLTYVFERAMRHLAHQGPQVLITRVLITHPSRFSSNQIAFLKACVDDVMRRTLDGVSNTAHLRQIRTLHEPLGAALHFLTDWRNQAAIFRNASRDDHEYTLLVYDFGGGTLDVTVLRVRCRRARRGGRSEPVPPHETVPELLRRLVAEKALAVLRQTHAGEVTLRGDGANDFVLGEFARSIHTVLGKAEPDARGWQQLASDPRVNDLLHLRYEYQGEARDVDLARSAVLPSFDDFARHWRISQSDEHPFAYTILPMVRGATGDRWLGGEDVSHQLQTMLAEGFTGYVRTALKTSDVILPLDADTCDIGQIEQARQNLGLLRRMAEQVKLGISRGESPKKLQQYYQSLDFWVKGERVTVSASELAKVEPPGAAALAAWLEPRLQASLSLIGRLLDQQQVAAPDVVVRVGNSSLLPLVGQVLERAWPKALHFRPEEAKACVVQGAALAALQLLNPTAAPVTGRPGVSLLLDRDKPVSITTCRLGLKVFDGNKVRFHELVGPGVPVPPAGLEVTYPLRLRPESMELPLVENDGLVDDAVLPDGRHNAGLEEVARFTIDVPEDADPFDLEDASLKLRLTPDMQVELEVLIPSRDPLRLGPVPLGGRY